MPQKVAKFVVIIWEDDKIEEYAGVTVEEHNAARKGEPPQHYKTLTVTPKKRVR